MIDKSPPFFVEERRLTSRSLETDICYRPMKPGESQRTLEPDGMTQFFYNEEEAIEYARKLYKESQEILYKGKIKLKAFRQFQVRYNDRNNRRVWTFRIGVIR